MEAITSGDLLQDILRQLTFLYLKLEVETPQPGMPTLDLPPLDILSEKLAASSFKVFTDPNHYMKSYRASTYPSWSSTSIDGFGSDVYRVFFNGYSKKIYVDFNAERWKQARREIETERLYCEILKTLVFVLTCGIREDKKKPALTMKTAADYPKIAAFGNDEEKTQIDLTRMISRPPIKKK